MINKKNISIFIFLLLISSQIFSQIEKARETYRNNKYLESIELYDNWLKKNYQSKELPSILIEISELHGDIYSIIDILENYIENVSNRNTKKLLYSRIAQMFELSSNLQKAQLYYQKSALISLDEIDSAMLLKSAELLILEGNLYLADSQLDEIISVCLDQNILAKAHILNTILDILNSKNGSASIAYNTDSPESLYIYYLIARANSKTKEMNTIEKQIFEKFKSSPEAGLIKKNVTELPNIFTAFGLLKEHSDTQETTQINEDIIETQTSHNFMIQTGSFRDEENANYLSKDLQNLGFSATIEEQTVNNLKYYKVILYLPTSESVEKTLLDLKSKGFEGFPIY